MRKLVLLGLIGLIALFSAIPIAHAQTMTLVWSDKATYDNWVPTDNGTLTFTVNVKGLQNPGTGFSAGEIRFDFEKVSKWEGICMNSGETGKKADLFFRYSDQTVYTAPRWKIWSGDKVKAVAELEQKRSVDTE